MRRQLSLKHLFTLAFLTIGLVIAISYSILSLQFYVRGMDNIVAGSMENTALTFLASQHEFDETGQAIFRGSHLSLSWHNQPEQIRTIFRVPPTVSGELRKHQTARWLQRPDELYFVMMVSIDNTPVYISRSMSAQNMPNPPDRHLSDSLHLLLIFSGMIALTMALLIWLMLRHISQPVARLGQWTHGLNAESLNAPVPDFLYPELNALAQLIQRSLSSVQHSLEREHQFLRFTSHELRTPISVIRNNLELLHKIEAQPQPDKAEKQQAILERIDRASRTMQHLTETLLWLSRAPATGLTETTFDLQQVIEQLTAEMDYLLMDKQVTVQLETQSYLCSSSEQVVHIVLGNLIRNAYQHTWEGHVLIQQTGHHIHIRNQQHDAELIDSASIGFGLGLELTAQLCQKMGWPYENRALNDGHDINLSIMPNTQVSSDR